MKEEGPKAGVKHRHGYEDRAKHGTKELAEFDPAVEFQCNTFDGFAETSLRAITADDAE